MSTTALTVITNTLATTPHELLEDWLDSKGAATRRAYAGDIGRYAEWRDLAPAPAVAELLEAGPAGARRLAVRYRSELATAGKSPATVNRALAALKSVTDLARDLEIIEWRLGVKGMKARAYRDTRGPTRPEVLAIVEAADAAGTRDGAIVRLLYGLGLRRGEVAGLSVGDYRDGRIWILGKGRHDREPLDVPKPIARALDAWLEERGQVEADAPLFTSADNRTRGAALSDRSIARIVKAACRAAGVREVAPHALRHAAVTHALDATNGDVRTVAAFSRHAKLETVARYDDNRTNGGGKVAALIAL